MTDVLTDIIRIKKKKLVDLEKASRSTSFFTNNDRKAEKKHELFISLFEKLFGKKKRVTYCTIRVLANSKVGNRITWAGNL